MVYQLTRPTDHESMRQGALPMPRLESDGLMPWDDPLLVWSSGLTETIDLHNAVREVQWAVHNAGGAPCRVVEVKADVPWVIVECPVKQIEPTGLPIPVTLRMRPAGALSPGVHQAQISMTVVWGPRSRQSFTRGLTLRVPAGAIPWFEHDAMSFSGVFHEQPVSIASHHPVQVYYRDHKLAEPGRDGKVLLYPALYRLTGIRNDIAMIDVPGSHTGPVNVPGEFRVAGPVLRTRLCNFGNIPLEGRLVVIGPWLRVEPERVSLEPGESVTLCVECFDDGRFWAEEQGAVELRAPYADEVLAHLRVSRQLQVPGAWPVLTEPRIEFPPVSPGETSRRPVPVGNHGAAPLEVQPEFSTVRTVAAAGQTVSVDLQIGRPYTEKAGHIERVVVLQTSGRLPYWRFLPVPCVVDVVKSAILTPNLAFGTLRYRDQRWVFLKVQRSDHRRGRLTIDLPPELQETFRLASDQVLMRNMHLRPVHVDGEYEVRDLDLGGVVLGKVHITGHCLVPKLEVGMPPPVRLIPGRSTTVQLSVVDAGGGLEIHGIVCNRPQWAVVKRHDMRVTLELRTTRWERGVKHATVTFHSNDFVAPEQNHVLTVQLAPTFWMRLLDGLLWCVNPVWKRVRPVWERLAPALRELAARVNSRNGARR